MPGYQPSFGKGVDTPRRRNLTFDPHRKPVSISADTMMEIEQIRASYRASTEVNGPGTSGAKIERSTGRDALSFTRKYKDVNMDMTEEGIRALSTKDRMKQQTSMLRQVFRTMDANKDGVIDAADLESQLVRLGYEPDPGEVHDMIWEVDDDGDGTVNWREFKSIYQRVREDDQGKEPRRMYNVIEFMVFDIDNDGSIDLEEVMQLFYQRYGKDELFSETKDAQGAQRKGKDITFLEFVKHDESFYTMSREIADKKQEADAAEAAALAEEEGVSPREPQPPTGRRRQPRKLTVKRQNPGKLRARRHQTLGQSADDDTETETESVWTDDNESVVQPDASRGRGRYDEPVPDEEFRGALDRNAGLSPYMQAVEALKKADSAAKVVSMNDFPARMAVCWLYEEGKRLIEVACCMKNEEGEDVLNHRLLGALQERKERVNRKIAKLTPPVTKNLGSGREKGEMPAVAQRRVRRPSKIIYVHYGLQSAG